MYSNPHQWRRIRKRVMVSGESKRGDAASEGIGRTTLRKMLAFESPPGYWKNWKNGVTSESQIDMIARRIGLDPYDLRRRNLLKAGELFGPGDSAMDSHLARGLDKVAQQLGYRDRCRDGRRGMGMSIGLKDGGGTGNHGTAILKVTHDGYVFLHTATVEIGQGAMTALASIAAQSLGVSLDHVRCSASDTDFTPLDTGTHVSFGTTVNGLAVQRAAEDVKDQILTFAASQLNCSAADIHLDGWQIIQSGNAYPVTNLLLDYFGPTGVEFIGRGRMKIPYDANAPLHSKIFFWMPSWAGAEVDVDVETSKVQVLKLVVGADSGRSINPSACRGQVEGAAMQAYSQAMFEEFATTTRIPSN